jgi:hypothetical protein
MIISRTFQILYPINRGFKIIMKSIVSIILSIMLFFFFVTIAESADTTDLVDGKNVQWKSREYRIALAESIKSILLTFDVGIPNLSPEQNEWITKERSRIDSIKDNDIRVRETGILADSNAFRIERAKKGISQELTNIEYIKNPKTSLSSEMVCWAVLSLNLQDEMVFDSIQQLQKDGRIILQTTKGSSLITDSKYLEWGYWPENFGEGILEYIVIPYLVENQKNK